MLMPVPGRPGPYQTINRDFSGPHTDGRKIGDILLFGSFYRMGVTDIDEARGYRGVATNSPTWTSANGVDFPAGGTAYISYANAPTSFPAAIACVWRGNIRTGSAYRALISKQGAGGGASLDVDFRTSNDASPTIYFGRQAGAAINLTDIPLGRIITLGVSHDGSSSSVPIFYQNGTKLTTATAFGYTAATAGNTIAIGRRQDGSIQMDGTCELALIFNIKLSTAAQKAWADDPYPYGLFETETATLASIVASSTVYSRYFYDLLPMHTGSPF